MQAQEDCSGQAAQSKEVTRFVCARYEAAHSMIEKAILTRSKIVAKFHLQGHRGSRGTCPENTLPSFEHALDAKVSSIETDIHLTRDDIPVHCHDAVLSPSIFRSAWNVNKPLPKPTPIQELTLIQLQEWVAIGNPDEPRFPDQRAEVPPLNRRWWPSIGVKPFVVPALGDFYQFVEAYRGELGRNVAKTTEQQEQAARLVFDLEIKFVPFHSAWYPSPDRIIEQVVQVARQAGMEGRTVIRSFDHRMLKRAREICPIIRTAVLHAAGVPIDPVRLVRDAGASIYCPLFEYVDADLIRKCQDGGIRVLPWTVNMPEDWDRLIDWGVDGITTDYPDRLRQHLESRQIEWE
jgi:glycerophosphoryl diester phosphodiesterase